MSALAPLQMPFAVGLSSRFSMISSLRILHRPLPCPHRCRGWLQRWCAPHLAFRCTRPPIWGLPRMITWRWACGTTRHSPISTAAFYGYAVRITGFLLGGLLGLGTLICAFCLGPLIQFSTPMFPKTCCNMFQPGSRHNIYQRRNHNFAAAAALACRCFWLFNGILSKFGVRYKKT